MAGFAILVAFELLGFGLHRLGVPMPGAVIGLLLFTISLFTGVVKLVWVERASSLLLRNMMLFFVPVVIGAVRLSSGLSGMWLPILGSILVSVIAVMLTTGFVSSAMLRDRDVDE